MKQKIWVISIGGSRIVPDEVDYEFLERLKNLVESNPSHRFVAVTGGGSTARRYIKALRKLNGKKKSQALAGIAITRLHANFLSRLFGKKANEEIPRSMEKVKNLLKKNQVVFCGALRYEKKTTSDGTAAKLAAFLECPFINLTNVRGLYTSNPKTNKKAKFISKITWKEFNKIAKRIKFKAGQHFVLDQSAAKIILKKKVPTYIVGRVKAIEDIIRGKRYSGTFISG